MHHHGQKPLPLAALAEVGGCRDLVSSSCVATRAARPWNDWRICRPSSKRLPSKPASVVLADAEFDSRAQSY